MSFPSVDSALPSARCCSGRLVAAATGDGDGGCGGSDCNGDDVGLAIALLASNVTKYTNRRSSGLCMGLLESPRKSNRAFM